MPLSSRAEAVLKSLVSLYIDSANPVGSTRLANDPRLGLSSASIRHVMADLERQGLIESPHTSAGRIPTQEGYRMFVNSMLTVQPLGERALGEIEERFSDSSDPKQLCTGASEILSQITSYAGIVSMPAIKYSQLRQVEFLKLSEQRILAIIITNDGQVQNKVLDTEKDYSKDELIEAANFFNRQYTHRSLNQVRRDLLKLMAKDSDSMNALMRTALSLVGELLPEDDEKDVLLSGENNLFSVPEFSELKGLQALFDAFKMKQVLLDLLQKSESALGVNIFVGEESGYIAFKHCSLIMAPYEMDDQQVGVLGVIGPTRMDYDEVISVVDVTAKLLGNALSNASH
jgi:heat-inducible transcriptional repressor